MEDAVEAAMALAALLCVMGLACWGVMSGLDYLDEKGRTEREAWREQHCIQKMVVDVGGCTMDGTCMVRYDDDMFGKAKMPIKGLTTEWCGE